MKKLGQSKAAKILFSMFFAMLTVTTLIIPITSYAISWNTLKDDVAELITVKGMLNIYTQKISYVLLRECCELIDMFESAIDKLITINLYDLIKSHSGNYAYSESR
jgi:hypothetical protein